MPQHSVSSASTPGLCRHGASLSGSCSVCDHTDRQQNTPRSAHSASALLSLVFDFSNALDLTHHWYSTLAALAAVSVLMGGVNLRRIFAAGVLSGISTLFTQTQGGLTFVALIIYPVMAENDPKPKNPISDAARNSGSAIHPNTLLRPWVLHP